ncbi:hypothetical protein [Microbulbifer sp. SSSA005]|uniref:hypothetical protein n=1 Tax=Microbulbifer sp. SSSA005 TaxID=3243378 RepID=UPI0040393CF6
MNNKRTLLALLLSPIASSVLIVAILVDSLFNGQSLVSFEGLLVLTLFAIGSIVVSYVFVLLVGLPIHFVFSKLNITSWLAYTLSGIVVAISYQYIQYLGDEMPAQLQEAGYALYAGGGLIVSLVFWYFAVKPHNNNRQSDAKNARVL